MSFFMVPSPVDVGVCEFRIADQRGDAIKTALPTLWSLTHSAAQKQRPGNLNGPKLAHRSVSPTRQVRNGFDTKSNKRGTNRMKKGTSRRLQIEQLEVPKAGGDTLGSGVTDRPSTALRGIGC
jgi:hypothetical protein